MVDSKRASAFSRFNRKCGSVSPVSRHEDLLAIKNVYHFTEALSGKCVKDI